GTRGTASTRGARATRSRWIVNGVAAQALVQAQVVVDHPRGSEVLLDVRANRVTFELLRLCNRRDGRLEVVCGDRRPAGAVGDQLGHRTTTESNDWCAGRHRFDHGQAKRLVKLDQVQ